MVVDGYTNKEIADKFGFSREAIDRRWPKSQRELEPDRETALHCCPAARHIRILLNKSHVTPSGCWQWDQYTDLDGYGTLKHGAGTIRAHRWSYEALIGPIPTGLVIDHLCRNRGCVNPEHLEPVTVRENNVRGQGFGGSNSRKATCLRGHPSFRFLANGQRSCPDCMRDDKRARRERNAVTGLPIADSRHGTQVGYSEFKCRCDPCRAAKARSRRAYR